MRESENMKDGERKRMRERQGRGRETDRVSLNPMMHLSRNTPTMGTGEREREDGGRKREIVIK